MLRLAETSLPVTQLCRLLTLLILALPFHTELWQDWVSANSDVSSCECSPRALSSFSWLGICIFPSHLEMSRDFNVHPMLQ